MQHFNGVFSLKIHVKFDILRCWLAKIKHWIWCCTTSPNIN